MVNLLRLLLLPIVPVYYAVVWLRNKLYDWEIKKSQSYAVPVIAVGNLSVGGTGKTPMIEYLVRLLGANHRLGILSRGYKRKSKGFILADEHATAESLGDEPFQFHQKFPKVLVSVDADRRNGIAQLLSLPTPPQIILLDDAFQHRKVKAGFYILLTAYNALYADDYLLPTGNLREPRSGAVRAQMIVVTKCPAHLSEAEKSTIIKRLKPARHQKLFFSHIAYAPSVRNPHAELALGQLQGQFFTLVTGIAKPEPLVKYFEDLRLNFEHLKFKDHHHFSASELEMLKKKSLIITTEKDFVRLQPHFSVEAPLYYLPIEIRLDRPEEFNKGISNFIK